jgi:hypothetical protein
MEVDFPETKFEIVQQGAIIVNDAWIRYQNDSVIIIDVDCKSKYFDVSASSGKGVFVTANDSTLYKDDENAEKDTWIEFLEVPVGFDYVASSTGRYTLTVVFHKNEYES